MLIKMWQKMVLIACLLTASQWVLAAPKVESWYTEKGAKVLFVPSPGLPMVDVRVVFDAGSARDDQKQGLAMMTNGVMTDSAGPWTADALAERLESVGAELGSGSLKDMAWVSLRCLTEPQVLEIGLESLSKILAEPAFSAQDLERNRQAALSALKQERESPAAIASNAFYAQLYTGHPYGSPSHGTDASIKSMTAEDLRAFHQQYYVAKNAVIALVGDLDLMQAKQLAERVVAGLPAGQHAPSLPEPANPSELLTQHIEHPSSQTHIQIGMLGVKRGDPDYFPLYVGNHILGGSGLVSILSDEVREKRGLSYSVYSYFSPMRTLGPFLLGAQTRNIQADETRQVILKTLARYIEQGPTEKELQAAKDNISGGFPLKVSSNSKIVEYLAMIGFYDLPLDHLDTLVFKVKAVTREQIRDAFQRRLTPSGLVTITVGKRETAHGG